MSVEIQGYTIEITALKYPTRILHIWNICTIIRKSETEPRTNPVPPQK